MRRASPPWTPRVHSLCHARPPPCRVCCALDHWERPRPSSPYPTRPHALSLPSPSLSGRSMVASRQSRHCRALELPPQLLLCSLPVPIKCTTIVSSSGRPSGAPSLAVPHAAAPPWCRHGHRCRGHTQSVRHEPPLVELWLLVDARGPPGTPPLHHHRRRAFPPP
jgi:hypothetical protein